MRETGPVRFVPASSPQEAEAAKPYIGIARTQLGITKNLMSMGGLESLTRRVVLSDGTLIVCQSVFGNDIVSITPSAQAVAAAQAAIPEETQPKKQIPIYGYGYRRLQDGPPKHGHQTMWDFEGNRLLVFSGYDASLQTMPPVPNLDDRTALFGPGGIARYAIAGFDGISDTPNYNVFFADASREWLGARFHYQVITDTPTTWEQLGPEGPDVMGVYFGGTPADHVDGFQPVWPDDSVFAATYPGNFHILGAASPTYEATGVFDLLFSHELWEYTFADGWRQLSNISQAEFTAMAGLGYVHRTITDDGTDTFGGDAVKGSSYDGIGTAVDDLRALIYGGSIDGTITNQSSQLWLYGPVVVGWEDDPNA